MFSVNMRYYDVFGLSIVLWMVMVCDRFVYASETRHSGEQTNPDTNYPNNAFAMGLNLGGLYSLVPGLLPSKRVMSAVTFIDTYVVVFGGKKTKEVQSKV